MNVFLYDIFPPFFQPSFLSSLMCFYTLLYPPVFICLSFIHLIFPNIRAFWSLSIPPVLSTSPSSHNFSWLPHLALPPLFVFWLLCATSSLQLPPEHLPADTIGGIGNGLRQKESPQGSGYIWGVFESHQGECAPIICRALWIVCRLLQIMCFNGLVPSCKRIWCLSWIYENWLLSATTLWFLESCSCDRKQLSRPWFAAFVQCKNLIY